MTAEIGSETEEEIDNFRRADLHSHNDDWTRYELGVSVVGQTNVEEIIDGVHLFLSYNDVRYLIYTAIFKLRKSSASLSTYILCFLIHRALK